MSEEAIWFSVRLIFESLHPDENSGERLFEDRIILVRAVTEEEAQEKAEAFGKAAKEDYKNVHGKRVQWVFKEILDVVYLPWEDNIGDGSEVYYAFLTEKRLEQLRQILEPFEN